MYRNIMILLFLFLSFPVRLMATVEDKILIENIKIDPGTSYHLTINSKTPVRLGLFITGESVCETACISLKQVNNPFASESKIDSNVFSKHYPEDGKAEMKYSNISKKPVSITIHQYIYHCDSEACSLLKKKGIKKPIDFASKNGEYKRLRIASIDAIKTTSDGSWSDVSGTTIFGEPFDVTFIWWKYDPEQEISCGQGRYIERYKKRLSEGGDPVLIAGTVIYQDRPIFIKVDACAATSSTPKNADDF